MVSFYTACSAAIDLHANDTKSRDMSLDAAKLCTVIDVPFVVGCSAHETDHVCETENVFCVAPLCVTVCMERQRNS